MKRNSNYDEEEADMYFQFNSNEPRPRTMKEAVELHGKIQKWWEIVRPLLARIRILKGSSEQKALLFGEMITNATDFQNKVSAMRDAILPELAKRYSKPMAKSIMEMPEVAEMLRENTKRRLEREIAEDRANIKNLADSIKQQLPQDFTVAHYGQSERHFLSEVSRVLKEAAEIEKVSTTRDLPLLKIVEVHKLADFKRKLLRLLPSEFAFRSWSQSNKNLVETIKRCIGE